METLSDKIVESGIDTHLRGFAFTDVKQFIKDLKEDIGKLKFYNANGDLVTNNILELIDKLAGEKLL